jgi:kynurenine formamidase
VTPVARRFRLALALLLAAPAVAQAAKLFSVSLEDVAAGRAQVVDLTHDLTDRMPTLPGAAPFALHPPVRLPDGTGLVTFSCGEHTGTHIDVPAHVGRGLPTVDEIAPVRLVSQGVVIDVRPRTGANPDYALTLPDLEIWEKQNGKIPPRAIVILNTGWHQRWEDADRYLNRDDKGLMHFPGFSVEAIKFLMQERDINALGIDTASVDPGLSTTLDGHKALLRGGRYQVENLHNLDLLPARGFGVIVAPLKVSRGTAAPARVLAIVPR